jgi:hypothetical protein
MAPALVSLASPGRTLLYEHGNLLAQLPHLLLERQKSINHRLTDFDNIDKN